MTSKGYGGSYHTKPEEKRKVPKNERKIEEKLRRPLENDEAKRDFGREPIFISTFGNGKKTLHTVAMYGALNNGLDIFENLGFKLIGLNDNIKLRLDKGKYSLECNLGNYVKEAFVYRVKDGKVFLVRDSPILRNLDEATRFNKQGLEWTLSDEELESSLEDSVAVPRDLRSIPVDRIKDEEITLFAFGEESIDAYTGLLKEADIPEVPITVLSYGLIKGQKHSFARQGILRCFDNWSGLIGSDANLHLPYTIRGVSHTYNGKTNEINETYNLQEITKALERSSLSGNAMTLIRTLRQNRSIPLNPSFLLSDKK